MSYILDALKKSDQERKRGDVPNLQTVHIPMSVEQHTPWMLYGFIAFLLLALSFVIGMVISDKEQPQSDQQAALSAMSGTDTLTRHTDKNGLQGIVEPMAQIPETAQKSAQIPADAAVVAPEVVQHERKVVQLKAQTSESAAKVSRDLGEIPYLHELADYQQQSIPEMRFAGHVYSSSASNRSVIINNDAMSEGDIIVQGLSVEEITTNGVVFLYKDQLFKMDILQDWSFE